MKGFIGWAIIWAVISTVYAVYTFKNREKIMEKDHVDMSFIRHRVAVVSMATLVSVSIVMSVVQAQSLQTNLYRSEESYHYDLYALEGSQSTHKDIFCIQEDDSFTYCYKAPDGYYVIGKISTTEYKVRIDDSGKYPPRIQYHRYVLKNPDSWQSYFLLNTKISRPSIEGNSLVVIYIPKGSMVSN